MGVVKTGLILEGGGMRSLFSMGIVDLMCEEGIRVDGIVGVSAGACFGCNYKSHQPGRALRYNILMKDEPRYMGVRTLLRTGNLLDPVFAYHTVPEEIDVFDKETFGQDPTEFHVVCTDIRSGEAVYKKLERFDYDTLEWIRASSSMPLVSTPVELEGRLLLDGGIMDSIPVEYAQRMGFERNIVILTQPREYVKKPSRVLPPMLRMFMRKYPKVAEMMARRHELYNRQREFVGAEEASGRVLAIYPDEPLKIGRTCQKEDEMRRVYDLGRRKGRELLRELKSYVKSVDTLQQCAER